MNDRDGESAAVLQRVEGVWADLVDLADRIAARRNPPDAALLSDLLAWCDSAQPVVEDYRLFVQRFVTGSFDDMAVLTGGRSW